MDRPGLILVRERLTPGSGQNNASARLTLLTVVRFMIVALAPDLASGSGFLAGAWDFMLSS